MDANTGVEPAMAVSTNATGLPATTVALIETLLASRDAADVKGRLRQGHNIRVSHEQVFEIYQRIAKTKLGRSKTSDFRPPLEAPADFVDVAVKVHNPELAAHYGVSVATVSRWRRETGAATRPPSKGRGREAVPAEFADRFTGRSVTSVAKELGLSCDKVNRWFREAGMYIAPRTGTVITPQTNRTSSFKVTPVVRNTRDTSRVGMAADHLRRLSGLHRCNERGGPDPKGSLWRRGHAILTDADIIQRAERSGWQPDAWMAVRGSTPADGARA